MVANTDASLRSFATVSECCMRNGKLCLGVQNGCDGFSGGRFSEVVCVK